MLKNYIKISLRTLMKNKVFVLINVFGLGITLACCIVAYLNYDYNAKYDQEQVHAEKIYRVNFIREYQGNITKYGFVPIPLANVVENNIGDVSKVTRFGGSDNTGFRIGDDVFNSGLSYVDENFFEFFTFDIIKGNAEALKEKKNIIISDELAKKYFGNEEPIGQQITQIVEGGNKEYFVAAVFQTKKANSSFAWIHAFTNYQNSFDVNKEADENSWNQWTTTFLWVDNPASLGNIDNQLQAYVEPQNNVREDFKITKYYLDPFVGFAQRAEAEDLRGHWFRQSLPVPAVVAPLVMAGLVLLIACFNFTNTSISISSRRLKEIGIRKVMGGMRKQLIYQFLFENLLLCFFALVVALIIAEFLVPAYNDLWDFVNIDLNYLENMEFFGFLLVMLMGTGLLAGSYPAFYISKFEPSSILKGTYKFGGKGWLTKILWCLQYSISLGAVISGAAFYHNAIYQENLDYGYDKDAVIHFWLNDANDYDVFKAEFASNEDIVQVCGTKHQIFESYYRDPIKFEEVEEEVNIMEVGEDYFSTVGMEIIEGRAFQQDSETDRLESIVVNEEMAKKFGWEESIGKKVRWMDSLDFYVVGVVENFYLNGLWAPIEPMMIRATAEENYRLMIVKTKPEELTATFDYIGKTWNKIHPDRLVNAEYLNESIQEAVLVNANIVKMFVFLGLIAVILSATGLFTLVSLNIVKRMKEIGVRKVLGASVANIATVVNKQFAIFMLIAFVLGAGMSYAMVEPLMASIWTYYSGLTIFTVIISILVMVVISLLSVGYKIYSAANSNPAVILKDE